MANFLRGVNRAQLLFLCTFFGLIFFGFLYVPYRGVPSDTTEDKYEVIGNQLYIRDHRGFLYPKGYFDVPPSDPLRPFKDLDLSGRHSDTVLPECDDPEGVDPALSNTQVGWVHAPNYLPNYKNPCWYGRDLDGNHVLQCIPYFYLIGMAKSGSTDLFYRINQHPDVEATPVKEHRWFDDHRFRNDSKSDFSFYLKRYGAVAPAIEEAKNGSGYHQKICGDGSPSYSWDNIEWFQLPENQRCLEPRALILSYIHHLTPNAKLILILRNPVDRLYSHYLYHTPRTGAKEDPNEFHQWVVDTLQVYTECYKNHPFRYCMYSKQIKRNVKITSLTSSIYSRLILDILKIFPRKQLLILEMKDYGNNLKKRLKEVYKFLELKSLKDTHMDEISTKKQKNRGKSYKTAGPMLNKTKKILTDFFRPFNMELAHMMGDNKYLWSEEL